MNPYESLSNSIFGAPAPGSLYSTVAAANAAGYNNGLGLTAPAPVRTTSAANGGGFGSAISNFFGGLTNVAAAVAPTVAQVAATRAIYGRQPGAEIYANPLAQPTGYAGQPGTMPVINTSAALASATPWLLLGGAIVAGVLIAKALK